MKENKSQPTWPQAMCVAGSFVRFYFQTFSKNKYSLRNSIIKFEFIFNLCKLRTNIRDVLAAQIHSKITAAHMAFGHVMAACLGGIYRHFTRKYLYFQDL